MSRDPFDTETLEAQVVDENVHTLGGQLAQLGFDNQLTRVQDRFVTAVRVELPRNSVEVQRRVKEEATFLGERAYYGWSTKNKDGSRGRVEGPTQALAHAVARCYGNCAVAYGPIQSTPEEWFLTAAFVDRETGFTLERPFRMSKASPVPGKMDRERAADYRFQNGASRAARNVIVKALERLCKEGMEVAKQGVRSKIENFVKKKGIASAQDLLIGELEKVGVAERSVLDSLGVAERKALSIDNMVDLRAQLRAIQDGEVRPEEVFGGDVKSTGSVKVSDVLGDDEPKKDDAPAEPKPVDPPKPKPADEPKQEEPKAEPKPKKLTAANITKLKKSAKDWKVEWSSVEETFGGPIEDFEIEDAFTVVTNAIRELGEKA